MRAAELAKLSLCLKVQLVACSAQELESLHSGQLEAVKSQQRETKLDDNVLHREVTGQEHHMLRSVFLNINVSLLPSLLR